MDLFQAFGAFPLLPLLTTLPFDIESPFGLVERCLDDAAQFRFPKVCSWLDVRVKILRRMTTLEPRLFLS